MRLTVFVYLLLITLCVRSPARAQDVEPEAELELPPENELCDNLPLELPREHKGRCEEGSFEYAITDCDLRRIFPLVCGRGACHKMLAPLNKALVLHSLNCNQRIVAFLTSVSLATGGLRDEDGDALQLGPYEARRACTHIPHVKQLFEIQYTISCASGIILRKRGKHDVERKAVVDSSDEMTSCYCGTDDELVQILHRQDIFWDTAAWYFSRGVMQYGADECIEVFVSALDTGGTIDDRFEVFKKIYECVESTYSKISPDVAFQEFQRISALGRETFKPQKVRSNGKLQTLLNEPRSFSLTNRAHPAAVGAAADNAMPPANVDSVSRPPHGPAVNQAPKSKSKQMAAALSPHHHSWAKKKKKIAMNSSDDEGDGGLVLLFVVVASACCVGIVYKLRQRGADGKITAMSALPINVRMVVHKAVKKSGTAIWGARVRARNLVGRITRKKPAPKPEKTKPYIEPISTTLMDIEARPASSAPVEDLRTRQQRQILEMTRSLDKGYVGPIQKSKFTRAPTFSAPTSFDQIFSRAK